MNFCIAVLLSMFLVSMVVINGTKEEHFFYGLNDTFWQKWRTLSQLFSNAEIRAVNNTEKVVNQTTEKIELKSDLITTETPITIELPRTTELPVTSEVPITTVVPETTEKVRTPDETREAYFAAKGDRISTIKCNQYKYMYDFIVLKARNNIKDPNYRVKTHTQGLADGVAIGGRNTTAGEFPHMGALGWRALTGEWMFKCGSTLISNNFLLTAAHCSWISTKRHPVVDPKPQIVRLGTTNIEKLSRYAIDVPIVQIIVHPDYRSPKQYNDIALMKLEKKIRFNLLLQPACVWLDLKAVPPVFGTGWGYTSVVNKQMSAELQAVEIKVIDSKECDEILKTSHNRHFKGIRSHQMCAGNLTGGVDTCQGDSGGPIQMKIRSPNFIDIGLSSVIGVTSFGYGCALPGKPSVYTRVSSYIDWIEDNVWPVELNSGADGLDEEEEDY